MVQPQIWYTCKINREVDSFETGAFGIIFTLIQRGLDWSVYYIRTLWCSAKPQLASVSTVDSMFLTLKNILLLVKTNAIQR